MLRLSNNSLSTYARILKRLAGAGLSRVLKHMWERPFGILSASHPNQDNVVRTKMLKKELRNRGYGFIDLKGAYVYEETGVPVTEDSVFVPGIDEETLRELATQFEQESYIFGTDGQFVLKAISGEIWASGSVEETFEPLFDVEVGANVPFMSQVRSKPHRQFRLDVDRPRRIRERQQVIPGEDRRVACLLVEDELAFYSTADSFHSKPPVSKATSGIVDEMSTPDPGLLDCWLPLH